jgi:hypothetical protein
MSTCSLALCYCPHVARLIHPLVFHIPVRQLTAYFFPCPSVTVTHCTAFRKNFCCCVEHNVHGLQTRRGIRVTCSLLVTHAVWGSHHSKAMSILAAPARAHKTETYFGSYTLLFPLQAWNVYLLLVFCLKVKVTGCWEDARSSCALNWVCLAIRFVLTGLLTIDLIYFLTIIARLTDKILVLRLQLWLILM